MKTKKLILPIVMLLLLIIATIGVTFAAFTFTKQGTVENVIESSTIMLTYTEGKTGITLNEAYPMSDEKGRVLTGVNNVFDFTVSATLGKDTVITYEVSAIKIPISDVTPLEDDEVKLYLERAIDPDTTYQEVFSPSNFIPLNASTEIGSPMGSMVLDTGTFINEGTTIHNYRLRLWVDENTQIPNGESRKYGVRINVYAKQIEAPKPTSELCFAFDETTGTITSYTTTYFDELGIEQIREECTSDVFIPDTINGVEVTTIGEYAFLQKGLTSVILPKGLQTIEQAAFLENQLTSVKFHEGLTTIGVLSFQDNQLSSIDIPSSVTSIGNSAFFNNPSLDEIAIGKAIVESGTLWHDVIVNKEISHAIVKEGATSIASNTFLNLGLSSVSLPDSLITINDSAFSGNKLKEVTIPNQVTTIGSYAFKENVLENVVLGEALKEIGLEAFMSNKIKSIIIPSSVTIIKENAFKSNQLTSVIFNEGLETIKVDAFAYNQLTNVDLPHSLTTFEVPFEYNESLNSISVGKKLLEKNGPICGGDGTNDGCFQGSSLSRVIIKEGVTQLGYNSLSSLGVKEVVLPDSLETIIDGALSYNQIENLVIPKNVTAIGSYSLMGNPLKQISNKTGRSFDWTNVIEGYSLGETFVTGTYGSVTITD